MKQNKEERTKSELEFKAARVATDVVLMSSTPNFTAVVYFANSGEFYSFGINSTKISQPLNGVSVDVFGLNKVSHDEYLDTILGDSVAVKSEVENAYISLCDCEFCRKVSFMSEK